MVSLVGVLDDYDLGLCWNGLSVVSQRHTILGLLHFEWMDCRSCGGSGLALIGKMRDFFFFGFPSVLWFCFWSVLVFYILFIYYFILKNI